MDQIQTTKTIATVGAVVSFVPVVGQIAGPIIAAMSPLLGKWLGKKLYTSGEKKLAEEYMISVQGISPGHYNKVPDAVVPEALAFFEALTGVHCGTIENWDALHSTPDAYFDRDKNEKLRERYSLAQVQLAIEIVKHYPKRQKWDTSYWYAGNFTPKNQYQSTPSLSQPVGVVSGVKPFEELEEVGIGGKLENPLTTHWWIWAVPAGLSALIAFLIFRKKRKW